MAQYNQLGYSFVILLLLIQSIDADNKYCYSRDVEKPQNKHYSTQTPPTFFSNVSYNILGCKPVKIWILTRHGTRYPKDSDTRRINWALPELQKMMVKNNNLCQEDFDLIKNWKPNTTIVNSALAMPKGWNDLVQLAQTYKSIFPTLFGNYSTDNYTFAHSKSQRTKASSKAFISGLFGPKLKPPILTIDIMLRPYIHCKAYKKHFKKKNQKNSEQSKFKNTEVFRNMSNDVYKRLGIPSQYTLDKDLWSMWLECTFQQAANPSIPSPWCAAFTKDNLKIMEYWSDMKNYYKCSNGYKEYSEKLPCAAVKDLLETMEDGSSTDNTVTAHFTHSALLLMILTAIGALSNELPLLATNYEMQENRQFKLSEICPYASSLAAVKYKCDAGQPSKVLMLLNQKPIAMPWCKNGSICTPTEIRRMFEQSPMKNCPYGICDKKFVKQSKRLYMVSR